MGDFLIAVTPADPCTGGCQHLCLHVCWSPALDLAVRFGEGRGNDTNTSSLPQPSKRKPTPQQCSTGGIPKGATFDLEIMSGEGAQIAEQGGSDSGRHQIASAPLEADRTPLSQLVVGSVVEGIWQGVVVEPHAGMISIGSGLVSASIGHLPIGPTHRWKTPHSQSPPPPPPPFPAPKAGPRHRR